MIISNKIKNIYIMYNVYNMTNQVEFTDMKQLHEILQRQQSGKKTRQSKKQSGGNPTGMPMEYYNNQSGGQCNKNNKSKKQVGGNPTGMPLKYYNGQSGGNPTGMPIEYYNGQSGGNPTGMPLKYYNGQSGGNPTGMPLEYYNIQSGGNPTGMPLKYYNSQSGGQCNKQTGGRFDGLWGNNQPTFNALPASNITTIYPQSGGGCGCSGSSEQSGGNNLIYNRKDIIEAVKTSVGGNHQDISKTIDSIWGKKQKQFNDQDLEMVVDVHLDLESQQSGGNPTGLPYEWYHPTLTGGNQKKH